MTTTSMTVEEFDRLVGQIFQIRSEIATLNDQASAKEKELFGLKCRAVEALKEFGRKNYQTPKGTISIRNTLQVSLPKTEEDKRLMFEWMKDKGIYEKFATVNYNSLKSLVKSHMEEIEATGGDPILDFIPGVPAPTLFQDLTFTKGKGGEDE
jgi:hypothetical protein